MEELEQAHAALRKELKRTHKKLASNEEQVRTLMRQMDEQKRRLAEIPALMKQCEESMARQEFCDLVLHSAGIEPGVLKENELLLVDESLHKYDVGKHFQQELSVVLSQIYQTRKTYPEWRLTKLKYLAGPSQNQHQYEALYWDAFGTQFTQTLGGATIGN